MPESQTYEIEAVEKAEVEAILRNDLEALGHLWSDDLIAASNENLILGKRQLFALFEAGLVQLETLERDVSKAVVRDNCAFVTGHEKSVSRIGVRAGEIVHSSYMSSWVCDHGVWRLAARHQAAMARVPRGDQNIR